MSYQVNRRKFAWTSFMGVTAVMSSRALAALVGRTDAAQQVFALLKEHLKLEDEHRSVVELFTLSLQTTTAHSQSAGEFNGQMRRYESRKECEELVCYVVQEFVVSTNYLAYAAGKVSSLRLVKGVATTPRHSALV